MEWAGRLGLSAVRGGDLALTLELPRAAGEDAGRTEKKTGRLLLNLRPSPDADRYARLAAPYAAAFPGEVVGVALSGEDEALLGAMKGAGKLGLERVERVSGLEDTARLWSGASAAVGMRLHFAVLSALWGTPLAVLRTRIDVFRKKERQQTEYDELVNTMETYVNRLSSLVGNLLELTDTGELPDVQRVSLDSVLAHVAADLGPLAHESNVSLSCHAQPVSIMGNASLLYRAFYNLAENAIRYNFNGGKVELQLSASREGAVATVSDTGVGIAPDVRELVFEPFYRVNKSRSREFGGAGIGLSLVKTILARHGARVAVGENQPQGSVFTVTFGSGGEVLTERG